MGSNNLLSISLEVDTVIL